MAVYLEGEQETRDRPPHDLTWRTPEGIGVKPLYIAVICGGIPSQDYTMLRRAGVAAIYGPGAHVPAAAAEVLEVIRQRRVVD